jgi:3-oxoacyl-(acyl-carrier-protein) synthase
MCAPLGEGAVLFAMEPDDTARARGAKVRAEVSGYGTSFVAPESDAELIYASADAMERAIAAAIVDAQILPKDIDVVASSVSGLEAFDARELDAIERVLGARICVAAPKALLGETLGAGGGMGMAAALAWLEGAPVTPVVRGEAKGAPPRTVLVTSMGFYGNASAVVVRET